jgi:hypothetical protein
VCGTLSEQPGGAGGTAKKTPAGVFFHLVVSVFFTVQVDAGAVFVAKPLIYLRFSFQAYKLLYGMY